MKHQLLNNIIAWICTAVLLVALVKTVSHHIGGWLSALYELFIEKNKMMHASNDR